MTSENSLDELQSALRKVIRRRKTSKVFGAVNQPLSMSDEARQQGDVIVRQCIDDAGWAPFHFDRKVDGIAEPWRVHWIKQESCRLIASHLSQWFSDLKPNNKMPALLSACGCVILVAWLPQHSAPGEDPDKLVGINEEHLAATAAFVQNMLLLLDASGMGAYWSTGGLFRTPVGYQRLQIPTEQRLLACVFVDYSPRDTTRVVETAGGGQRDRRSPSSKWTREVIVEV